MWIVGLTGAMGAGKSTLSLHFQSFGVPVLCADRVIHDLLDSDPYVHQSIEKLWPAVVVQGKVDRLLLGDLVLSSPVLLRTLEGILYPQLAQVQKKFLQDSQEQKCPIVVLDTPLLFEVGLDRYCDYVILAMAPYSVRKKRVLKRKGMSFKKFRYFESQRIPIKKVIGAADFVVQTGRHKGSSLKRIEEILFSLSNLPSPRWVGSWPITLRREPYDKRNRFRHRDNRV